MDVSIIVVNWNTCDFLDECLKSIFACTLQIKYEVIVVDNASTDGSADMVKRRFPQVVVIENAENRGFAAANNQGFAVARGRYVLLLNSDTIVMDNAIAKTVSFADAHPNAAVVGCRVLNPNRTLQPTCFMFPSVLNMLISSTYLYKLFPKNRFFGRERMSWWLGDDAREVDVITGCFMLVRCRAMDQVGIMDEDYFMYCEETDWCYRFKQAGWEVWYTPDAKIVHYSGQSTKQVALKMMLQIRGSVLQFMRKHRTLLEYKCACLLIWSFFVLRIPVWFIRAVLARSDDNQSRVYLNAYFKGMKILMLRGGQGLCVGTMSKVHMERNQRKRQKKAKDNLSSVVKIFGFPVNALRMSEVIKIAEQHILSREQLILGVVNVAKVVKSLTDIELRRSLAEADLVLADGLPIVWLSRIMGNPLPERLAGIDIMHNLIERSNLQNYRVYFLGAKEKTVQKVVEITKKRYPGLQIAGYRNGYFNEKEEQFVVEEIRRSKADIIFVAMSSPKKEIFLRKWNRLIDVPVCHGVGGSFDVVAGITRRGPRWMQKCGLEWLYRLFQEPRRMWKRYLVTNTIFLALSVGAIVYARVSKLISYFYLLGVMKSPKMDKK